MGIALLLALGGLAIWVAHLVTGSQALAWWASAFLVVVALAHGVLGASALLLVLLATLQQG